MQLQDWVLSHPTYGDIACHVPFSMYQTLLEAGKIADPFYRCEEPTLTSLSEEDFIFETWFEASEERLSEPYQVLRFEGIDTLATVYLNGKRLGEACNMHRIWEFDASAALHAGTNTLRVELHSPTLYMQKEQSRHYVWGQSDTMDGFAHIRKASYMFGWDWAPKLPDMGLFRPVTWLSYHTDRIQEVRLHQEHTVTGEVDLHLDIRTLHQAPGLSYQVNIAGPGCAQSERFSERTGVLHISDPQLWWPNGLGEQPLYHVSVTLLHENEPLDFWQRRIGLRTLTVSTAPDAWGNEFCFIINGHKVFAMGADYVPEDSLIGRIQPERTFRLIESCKRANFNSIRVWGGGQYPNDAFFDACDECGLIVWQDFMFACVNVYMSEKLSANIRQEAIDNIIRIRDHASLGLLCGNNEMEEAIMHWDGCKDSVLAKIDYLQLYEHMLPDLCAEYCPDIFYWPSSPSSGGGFDDPQDQNRGDAHYWGAWHGSIPFESYRQYYFRFCSEFGFESFPNMKTLRAIAEPEDMNPFSPVMMNHQKCKGGNAKILAYASDKYPYPYTMEDFVYTSQLLQAEAIRCGVEHFRRNRGRCMGAIYWQLNDCWPVSSWASVDYFGRWKALMYSSRRFFAPQLLTAVQEGDQVSFNVSNESLQAFCGTLRWTVYDTAYEVIASDSLAVSIPALSARDVKNLDVSAWIPGHETSRYLYYELIAADGQDAVSKQTLLFCKPKELHHPELNLQYQVVGLNGQFAIHLSANSLVKDVEVDLSEHDAQFSDNFVDLATPDGAYVFFSTNDPALSLDTVRKEIVIRPLHHLGLMEAQKGGIHEITATSL